MNIGVALTALFLVVTVLFIAIALYFPEWVGITGKKAKEYMREHQQEPLEGADPASNDTNKS